jgi:predicted Zn-dependent peptidase
MNARTRFALALLAATIVAPASTPAATGTASAAATAVAPAPPAAEPIPAHPRELRFPPLAFEVPRAEAHRHRLKNGVTLYLVEDHALPLFEVSVQARIGTFLDRADQPGAASLTGSMMRQGGAGAWTAEQLDERADFLASELASGTGDTTSSASVDCLSSALDDCLDLLFAMMMAPRFQQDRLDVEKSDTLEAMKQRNDDPESIQDREWGWLLFGRDHFGTRKLTAVELASVTREQLVAFHRAWWRPEQMVIAVSGDLTAAALLPRLEKRFAAWPRGSVAATVPWPPPAPTFAPVPGLYHVEKEIPQARVELGHRSRQWDSAWSDPHAYAALVMNNILGGGGFTSHLTKRIRSDEGLAYSAGSRLDVGVFWPGTFQIYFQSKNETAAFAAKIALEEVRAMQEKAPTEEELRVAKASFVESFPRRFDSANAVANLFAADDLLGRPHDYWQRYRDRIGAVTADDVQAAARSDLHPDRLVVLMVGPWAQLEPGDPQGRAKLVTLGLGETHHLPLRDPLTLEP